MKLPPPIFWTTVAILTALSFSGCLVSSGDYATLESQTDSLRYELQMEVRLNNQLQEYIDEVCYPRLEPGLRRAAGGAPILTQGEAIPDTMPKLKLIGTSMEGIYQLDEVIRFNPASIQLSQGSQALLQRVSDSLRFRDDLLITVVGHCDNTEENATEQFADSWELSVARANEVIRAMIGYGVSPGSLAASGRGRFSPLASNRSNAGKERNRRVEVLIRTKAVVLQ